MDILSCTVMKLRNSIVKYNIRNANLIARIEISFNGSDFAISFHINFLCFCQALWLLTMVWLYCYIAELLALFKHSNAAIYQFNNLTI